MSLFHLSHTDLDGYAAQFVSKFYFQNIKFFNSNYGKEIDDKFELILSEANSGDIILITDLNITLAQCEKFDKLCKEKELRLFLLDHHQSGAECATAYNWYYLDNSRCATKITYEFFSEIYGENDEISRIVSITDAVDIWQKTHEDFEFGKVCMELIASAKEINKIMFDNLSREYIFYLIEKTLKFNDYVALDEAIHGIKKAFFMREKDDSLMNLVSKFIVDELSKNAQKFEINFGDKRGILTYNIGSVSIIGNDFLVQNPQYDFFIDVTSRKTLSFRANGKMDVSNLAKILVGGGGHVNASGGFFAGFKDSFDYDQIKAQITNLIASKTQI